MRRLEVVIDELVVRGLSPERARAFAVSLESRLAVLAGDSAGPVRARAEGFRRLDPVTAKETELGVSVADAVWAAIA